MKISNVLISLLLISGMVAGFYSFFYNLGSSYGITNINDTGLASINYISTVSNFTDQISTKTTAKSGYLDVIFTDAGLIFGVFVQILTLPAILIAAAWDFCNILSSVIIIPAWFIAMVISICSVFIVFKVVEFFTNREA